MERRQGKSITFNLSGIPDNALGNREDRTFSKPQKLRLVLPKSAELGVETVSYGISTLKTYPGYKGHSQDMEGRNQERVF